MKTPFPNSDRALPKASAAPREPPRRRALAALWRGLRERGRSLIVGLVTSAIVGGAAQVNLALRTPVVEVREAFTVEGLLYRVNRPRCNVRGHATSAGDLRPVAYCSLSLRVTNTTEETLQPRDRWKLVSATGEEYPSDPRLDPARRPAVLPDYSVQFTVVFRVPREATLVSVVVTSSKDGLLGIDALRSEVRVDFSRGVVT